jgi:hypothetical protein
MPVSWRQTATVAKTTARIMKNKEADAVEAAAKAAAANVVKAAKAKKCGKDCKPESKE